MLKSHCQGGFSAAGLYPFDPRVVSKDKILAPPTTTIQEPASSLSNRIDSVEVSNQEGSQAIEDEQSSNASFLNNQSVPLIAFNQDGNKSIDYKRTFFYF